MTTENAFNKKEEVLGLRRECGEWLRSYRQSAGLSQRDIATQVGFDFYTFVSQIEAGRGRVPPERYEKYANALGVHPREFTKVMMRHYEPVMYHLLFDDASIPVAPGPRKTSSVSETKITALEERLAKLELLIQ